MHRKGIDGPLQFSGSTPDLDDFTIRIVDGTSVWQTPNNEVRLILYSARQHGCDYWSAL